MPRFARAPDNFGGHTGREIPLPIPNREVKPARADGTRRATSRESRSPPIYLEKGRPEGRPFLFPLTLRGTVVGYSARGATATIDLVRDGACRRLVWSGHGVRTRACTASRSTAASTPLPARIAGWPLPAQPRTLSTLGNIAVFAARGGGGLYAMRLDTGRFGLLGPVRATDMPRLTRRGVFYQDNEFKRDARAGLVRLKFVPTAGILERIATATHPIRTGDPISSLSMDGPRVALTVSGRRETCDRTATIARATTPLVGVQIERPGAAYAYGTHAHFVPTATLERLLGR